MKVTNKTKYEHDVEATLNLKKEQEEAAKKAKEAYEQSTKNYAEMVQKNDNSTQKTLAIWAATNEWQKLDDFFNYVKKNSTSFNRNPDNVRNELNQTLLMIATQYNCLYAAIILMKHEARYNTPYHVQYTEKIVKNDLKAEVKEEPKTAQDFANEGSEVADFFGQLDSYEFKRKFASTIAAWSFGVGTFLTCIGLGAFGCIMADKSTDDPYNGALVGAIFATVFGTIILTALVPTITYFLTESIVKNNAPTYEVKEPNAYKSVQLEEEK